VAVLQSRQQPCTCLLAEFWCTRCYMLANTQLANTQTLYCTPSYEPVATMTSHNLQLKIVARHCCISRGAISSGSTSCGAIEPPPTRAGKF